MSNFSRKVKHSNVNKSKRIPTYEESRDAFIASTATVAKKVTSK